MKKSIRNGLIVGAGLAAGAVVFSREITRYMVKLALDREEPGKGLKMARRIEKEADRDPLYRQALEDGQALAALPHEEVEIVANDGEVLIGHWFPAEHPKRIILAMHGWRSAWYRDFGGIAPFFVEQDCSVLYAEQRGQNASSGNYMGFGMLERYDCMDWLKWLEETQGCTLPVYLAGVSMGATTVLMTTGFDLPPQVKGVIADCGFTSAHAIWDHVCKEGLHLPYKLHQYEAERLCKQKIRVGTKDYSTVEALRRCKVPVLFIHGLEDDFVPPAMTYENFGACAAPRRLFTVANAGHGMSFYVDNEGYRREVLDLWNSCEQGDCGTCFSPQTVL